jgi:hypothetical protein
MLDKGRRQAFENRQSLTSTRKLPVKNDSILEKLTILNNYWYRVSRAQDARMHLTLVEHSNNSLKNHKNEQNEIL